MARKREIGISNLRDNKPLECNARYLRKLKDLGLHVDPLVLSDEQFTVLNQSSNLDCEPALTYADIYNYLIEYPD